MIERTMPTELKKSRRIYIDDETWEKMKRKSQEQNVSISRLLRTRIREWIEK